MLPERETIRVDSQITFRFAPLAPWTSHGEGLQGFAVLYFSRAKVGIMLTALPESRKDTTLLFSSRMSNRGAPHEGTSPKIFTTITQAPGLGLWVIIWLGVQRMEVCRSLLIVSCMIQSHLSMMDLVSENPAVIPLETFKPVEQAEKPGITLVSLVVRVKALVADV